MVTHTNTVYMLILISREYACFGLLCLGLTGCHCVTRSAGFSFNLVNRRPTGFTCFRNLVAYSSLRSPSITKHQVSGGIQQVEPERCRVADETSQEEAVDIFFRFTSGKVGGDSSSLYGKQRRKADLFVCRHLLQKTRIALK